MGFSKCRDVAHEGSWCDLYLSANEYVQRHTQRTSVKWAVLQCGPAHVCVHTPKRMCHLSLFIIHGLESGEFFRSPVNGTVSLRGNVGRRLCSFNCVLGSSMVRPGFTTFQELLYHTSVMTCLGQVRAKGIVQCFREVRLFIYGAFQHLAWSCPKWNKYTCQHL